MIFQRWKLGRFTLLLWSLPAFLVISQLIGDLRGWRVLFDLFIALLLVGGVKSTGLSRSSWVAIGVLACIGLLAPLLNRAVHESRLEIVGTIALTLFMVLVTGAFLVYAVSARRVDTDLVSAAVCAYFLIGLTFGILYTVIESISPASFIVNAAPPPPSTVVTASPIPTLQRADFVYFSLVAMTTVGFGDIVPVSRLARALTVVEILIGQLYLVVMIARLVSVWQQPHEST